MKRVQLRCFVFLLFAATAFPAIAHDPGLSSLDVEIESGRVTSTMRFASQDGAGIEWPDPPVEVWLDDQPLIVIPSKEKNPPGTLRTVFARAAGSHPARIEVRVPSLAEFDPGHKQLLRVLDSTDRVVSRTMLDQQSPGVEMALPSTNDERTNNPIRAGSAMILLGIEHIASGFDHLLFLAALLLTCTELRSAAKIITGFTAAHSLTLGLATYQLIAIEPDWVEPAIAASIVIGAVMNLLSNPSVRARVAIAFTLGLVHGLGFAGLLGELAPSGTANRFRLLLEFNLGVEIGQILFSLPFLAAMALLQSRSTRAAWVPAVGSGMIAMIGAVWFIERIDVF